MASQEPSSPKHENEQAEDGNEAINTKMSAPARLISRVVDAGVLGTQEILESSPVQTLLLQLKNKGLVPSNVGDELKQRFVDAGLQFQRAVEAPGRNLTRAANQLAASRDRWLQQIHESMGDAYHLCSVAYLSRLFAALLLFFITGYINATAAATAGWRTPYVQFLNPDTGEVMEGALALPDLGLDAVAYVGSAFLPDSWIKNGGIDWPDGPDRFVHIHGIVLLLFLTLSPQRLKVFRRLLVVYAVLNLFRAFTVIATSLPDPTPKCHSQFTDSVTGAYKKRPIFPNNMKRAVKAAFGATTCGDLIFSGHSVLMLIVMKTVTEYCRTWRLHGRLTAAQCTIICSLMRTLTFVGLMTVLATRFHYTLDVAIAFFLTLRTWDTYHVITRTLALRKPDNCFMSLLVWFENEEVLHLESWVYEKTDGNQANAPASTPLGEDARPATPAAVREVHEGPRLRRKHTSEELMEGRAT